MASIQVQSLLSCQYLFILAVVKYYVSFLEPFVYVVNGWSLWILSVIQNYPEIFLTKNEEILELLGSKNNMTGFSKN